MFLDIRMACILNPKKHVLDGSLSFHGACRFHFHYGLIRRFPIATNEKMKFETMNIDQSTVRNFCHQKYKKLWFRTEIGVR